MGFLRGQGTSGLRLKAASTRVRSACEVPPKMNGRRRRWAYSRSAKMLSLNTMILSPRTCTRVRKGLAWDATS